MPSTHTLGFRVSSLSTRIGPICNSPRLPAYLPPFPQTRQVLKIADFGLSKSLKLTKPKRHNRDSATNTPDNSVMNGRANSTHTPKGGLGASVHSATEHDAKATQSYKLTGACVSAAAANGGSSGVRWGAGGCGSLAAAALVQWDQAPDVSGASMALPSMQIRTPSLSDDAAGRAPSRPHAHTRTGETGSYRYMAPEVFRHEPYNNKVDVYR